MPLPPFSLPALDGSPHQFPTGRHALLCFVKEDCPTCVLSMPLIQAAAAAFGDSMDVWCIGQDDAGNRRLAATFALTAPMLDDSALHVSYRYDLDTVPTIILADGDGEELERFIGFGKADWQALFKRLISVTLSPAPVVDWPAYPESRPGCGSRSVEPGIAERLQAEMEGSPIRARRIDVGESDDIFEFMFDQGLTDGLPVIPPTPERVVREGEPIDVARHEPAVEVKAATYAGLKVQRDAAGNWLAQCIVDV